MSDEQVRQGFAGPFIKGQQAKPSGFLGLPDVGEIVEKALLKAIEKLTGELTDLEIVVSVRRKGDRP